jgi:chaperonin GroEL (HSP60 family)
MGITFKTKNVYSNIIGTREVEKRIQKVLNELSSVFTRTLGPYGMNTIIEDNYLHHVITKDGFTVYTKYVAYDRVARAISRFFLKISSSLNEIVGDGTTSSVIVAKELYTLKKLIKKYKIPPQTLITTVEAISKLLIDRIEKRAFRIELDKSFSDPFITTASFRDAIKNIASISLNNDSDAGSFVADVFCSMRDPEHGFVNVEVSKNKDTHFDLDRGFEIPRGMVLPEMVTEADGRRAIYLNPLILTIKGSLMTNDLEAIHKITHIANNMDRPLVIIAGGFSKVICETFRQSIIDFAERHGKHLRLMCVEMDTDSEFGKETLLDLQANIGSRIITVGDGKNFPIEQNELKYLDYCGSCDKIVANLTTYTRIIGGKRDDTKIQFRIEEIDRKIEEMKSEQHIDNHTNIFLLERRKASLLNDMVTVHVGGDTLEEKENKAYLYDDAVRGCRSAIRKGYISGGNTAVAKICHEILEKIKNSNHGYITRLDVDYKVLSNLVPSIGRKKAEEVVIEIFKIMKESYIRVYATILNNKFLSWKKSMKVARECVEVGRTYNLITDELEAEDARSKVVNSSEVDTQILKAAISILKLVITSNQFVRIPEVEQMKKNM